ncbi:MAG: hypothetical protein L0Y66_04865 [Myxococcaceae bacterium]|nr:hypothetical protein [Myxococcaceae bacterium]
MDSGTYLRLKALCDEGEALFGARSYAKALERYRAARRILPEPIDEHEASTWVLAAIGDTLFQLGRHAEARPVLHDALLCPDALSNPFFQLRLGQVELELGNEVLATDHLAAAYLMDGRDVFEGEDPKYLTYVLARLEAPLEVG